MKQDEEEMSVSDIFLKHICTRRFLMKKIALNILYLIHEFIKYKTCHSFRTLFYWPDGFCADTVVIITFFIIAAFSLLDDAKMYEEAMERFL